MARCSSSSSCSCNASLSGGFSHGGGYRGLGVTPICNCGEFAVLRTARTAKNGGKQFWDCPNYKVRLMEFFVLSIG